MFKKFIISFLLITLSNLIFGCYHFKSVTVPEYEEDKYKEGKPNEIYVKTKDGRWYHFTNSNYYIDNDTLNGYGEVLSDDWGMPQETKIAVDDIESLGIEDINSVTTGLLWGIAIIGIIGIVLFFYWLFNSDKEINP